MAFAWKSLQRPISRQETVTAARYLYRAFFRPPIGLSWKSSLWTATKVILTLMSPALLTLLQDGFYDSRRSLRALRSR